MSRTAVIAGASGLVGGFCVQALLRDVRFDGVTALVRKPMALEHERLRQMEVDFDAPLALHPMTGGAVFSALGTTIRKAGSQEAFRKVDYEYPLRLAKAARDAGARTFVLVSSIGADARSSNFYLRVKGELEEAVIALQFPATHIFQPSLLMGPRAESRLGERIGIAVASVLQVALVGAWDRYRPVQAADVAQAMVHAAAADGAGVRYHRWRQIANSQSPMIAGR